MSEKQSVSDSASASGPGPSEEVKMEVNQDSSTEEGIIPSAEGLKEEIQPERFAYIKRKVEENRQKLLRITMGKARAAEVEVSRLRNQHPFEQHHNFSDEVSPTTTTADGGVDTVEGEEVNQ